jgi:phosphinothricin acetyltransferase
MRGMTIDRRRELPDVVVRPAVDTDLPSINDVYGCYVRETAITFALEIPSLEERAAWFDRHSDDGRHRVLVAEVDGAVVGWTSSGPVRARPAYETSVETSVYVSPGYTGRGIGSSLYDRLFRALALEDVHRAYAVMSLPNAASIALHERFGFTRAGFFSEQGRKFGRYWDVAWYEKRMDGEPLSAMHRNERLLRREYESRAARDDASLADTFAHDVVWHVPGRNAIAGDYHASDAVMRYVRRRRELGGDTFEISVLDVLANHEHGVVIASGRVTRNGKTSEWRAHGLYRFRDGLIAECWVLPEDQHRFDEIWS